MKNRYLLCLLLTIAMLYLAVPRLNTATTGLEAIFSISWLVFACIVLAGNLAALLFVPKKDQALKKVNAKKGIGQVRARE